MKIKSLAWLLLGVLAGVALALALARMHDDSPLGHSAPFVDWPNLSDWLDVGFERIVAQLDRVWKWVTLQY